MPDECAHARTIRNVTPSALGCEECLKLGSAWVHLRLCRTCGHVGCCDSSPNRHATKHFRKTQHPIIEGYDPPEGWRWRTRCGRGDRNGFSLAIRPWRRNMRGLRLCARQSARRHHARPRRRPYARASSKPPRATRRPVVAPRSIHKSGLPGAPSPRRLRQRSSSPLACRI
jgi:ubiquitin-hydrolase Zn-finger-containing protein